jgi:S1-C subfamily serine protease
VLARDERNDLALLAFDGGALAPLPLGSSESLKQGDEIAVIGCPVGLSPSLSTGIVSALRRNAPLERDPALEAWLVQITAPISPGSSGSPVMTRDGNVIGVAVGKVRMGENVNFAVPVERLRALVDGVPGGASPTPFAEPRAAGRLVRNLVISTLVFVVPFGIYAIVAWRRRARGGGGRGGEPARSRLLH